MRQCANAVDRANGAVERYRAVGAHQRLVPLLGVDQSGARRHQSALDQRCERNARRFARGHERRHRRRFQRFGRRNAFVRCLGVFGIVLATDEAPAQPLGDRAGGAGAAERIEHQIVGTRAGEDYAREQRFRLLRRMQLLAVAAFQAFLAGAQRQRPVGAHLDIFVAGFEHFVVERVAAGIGVARGPDQRLVRIGETAAAEIRHRVRLAPDHVVEDPEAEILHDRADAEDVVIGADHPDGGGRLHHASAGGEPASREVVIGGKTRELVPVIVDGIDA